LKALYSIGLLPPQWGIVSFPAQSLKIAIPPIKTPFAGN